ncbi:hydroxyphenylacetyl-CoA thioesterase PaaI [Dactylosporangium sp. AC04546]|uniref:hydroxyphenylacetyl-CoA thioesterase PaaI n=1 Tax=Dactylosporangium sp. AC04546 TaxID=2862460 RepID=UPI001EDCAD02|nr:hydroxyphenylacetyl-CoA thioesterase PaaI [Dactylosporangium sp. AC04546]WVK81590.1 hydroxyphenylacetyl-CoA thioesterase PaaI [Dactylosporangium sp. AC04546]
MDPEAVAKASAEAMYAADVASRSLGITIDAVAPGRATATMMVRADMLNGHAIGHGGFVFLLADTAFAFACNSYGTPTVAAGADVEFLEPVREGDVLTAVAVERVRRGRAGVYDVTVTRPDGTVVAEFRGRSRAIPPR